MKLNISNKKWRILTALVIVTALIPVLITAFELITTDKHSVVFLENYPTAISTIVLVYYALIFTFIGLWFIKQLVTLFKLRNQKTQSELRLLQSQVNPHFLFNMLNNLYGLVASNPSQAQALIIKISDLLRYGIYESKNEKVKISAEVAYIKNYIALQEMRYQKEMAITFNVDIMDDSEVAPLLFIILVENAFKHGVESMNEVAYVKMKLQASKGEVKFDIENNFIMDPNNTAHGLGLENLNRRLKLAYPKQHKLTTLVSENVYKSTLIVTLK